MATEWDDIQRRIGNRPNEIYIEEETLNKFILEEVESKGDVRQYSSLNELDEMLEETVEDEDERILLEYRKKRLAEMKAQAAGNRFGRCFEITKSSFIEEVSSTSHSHPVICLIFKRGNERGELLGELLGEIASRFPDVKFVKMADDQKANLDPMMVRYENGEPTSSYRPDMAKIREADDLEWSLSNKEWIKSEMEEDPRINQPNRLIINVKRKQSNKDVFASSA